MMRIHSQLALLAATLFSLSVGPVRAARVLEYNFGGGADGALVSGNTGGATVGTLDSSVDFPNTLFDSVRGGTLSVSRIKHWSDNPNTETAGGNFVGMTYDTTLPAGAQTRAGYDGSAVQFTRSGVLHESSEVPGSNTAFTAFARIYWQNSSLSEFETLFGSGNVSGQHDPTRVSKWWVGIDVATGRLTWNLNGDEMMVLPADGPQLTPNTWTDVAVTFSGDGRAPGADTLNIYIDGALAHSAVGESDFTPAVGSLRDDWSFWPAANPLTSTLQLGGSYHGVPPYHADAFVGLMERFIFFDNTLTDAEVMSLTVGQTGDFDGDGDVDGGDFLTWQRTDGTASGFADWQNNFGFVPGAAAGTSSVPEPAAIALACSLAGVLLVRRSRISSVGSAGRA